MTFANTGLGDNVLRAVSEAGYETPTPIQEKAIPVVMMGRDILGCAQTGTGKTASFTLPMIDVLAHGRARMRMPRSLILEPTRELAAQVAQNFDTYGKYSKLSKALLIGGTDMAAQAKLLDRGVDVLIATPGRLMDMFERGHILMNDIKILVIDEADRMLDMGFIPDVEKIVKLLPPLRQTLFFSATMAPEIKKLADKFLMNPKEISVSAPASASEMIVQGISILKVPPHVRGMDAKKKLKRDALRALIKHEEVKDAIIFCNRKTDITTVYKSLSKHGFKVGQLHGDMSQPARTEMLANFKAKKFNILVCSDVAARGLDIPDLSHVFNYDVPMRDEDYVHRIGRTGRAGREGHAFSIALPEDGKYITAIEALIGTTIPRIPIPDFDEGQPDKGDGRGARGTGNRPPRSEKNESDKKPRSRGGRGRNKPSGKPPVSEAKTDTPIKPEANKPAEAKPTEAKPADVKPVDVKPVEKKQSDRNSHGEKKPGHGSEGEEGSGLGGTDHMPAFLKGS
ncbi:MAG: DEAD/DEAH box helicase [Rhodospirillaceae bacterium]|nr:DEAD/DEAH box helicase [Rhodospirillaceae bacterium]